MPQVVIKDYHSVSQHFYKKNVDQLFYAPAWIEVLENTYNFKFFTAIEPTAERFIIFGWINTGFQEKIVSLPFSDYAEIEMTPDYWPIIQVIKDAFPNATFTLKTRGKAFENDLLEVSKRGFLHRITTTNHKTAIANQSATFKRNVRKAGKSDLKISLSRTSTDLERFYGLYHQLRKTKFNSIPQPFSFFENIYHSFISQEKGFILNASLHNHLAASIIVLEYNNKLYYKFGCSSEEYLYLRPNNLLFDHLITYACDGEFDAIDLGYSGASASYRGLVRFKESMGGVREDITYYQGNENVAQSQIKTEAKSLTEALVKTIVNSDLDAQATSRFSEIIYPFFA